MGWLPAAAFLSPETCMANTPASSTADNTKQHAGSLKHKALLAELAAAAKARRAEKARKKREGKA